ncbi:MAG TPA: hypothetical protein ENN91_04700 [Firmicutes bacterium]|nr:hypothetical protein [Bacillota bacterium]
MKLEGNCLTTAMGIMPHTDTDRALELALTLDIPFWPQLPRLNFYEDMYVQISEHFPGIMIDEVKREVRFSLEKFYEDIEEFLQHFDDQSYFHLSPRYSAVFHHFLERDLSPYRYIRGQSIGPVSYGLKILDEENKPMIYYEEVRQTVFDFVARKLQAQLAEMQEIHPRAFVWVDEPGLEMLFMAFSGYTSEKAKEDYLDFLAHFPGPRGVHLCGNPDWSFLLQMDLDVLSLDSFANGHIFSRYTEEVRSFLDRGGIISWGITPTLTEEFEKENVQTMIALLDGLWNDLDRAGIPREQLMARAWLAPARCCLINTDGEETVDKSFRLLRQVAEHFKEEL